MRARLPSSAAATAGLLALLLALAGCGGSSKDNSIVTQPPAEILAAAQAAADAASSVHVTGVIVSSGSPITLDLSLVAGKGGSGRLSEKGLTFEVIQIGQTIYIRGGAAFYRRIGAGAAAGRLQGRWLKAPANGQGFSSLSSLTNLRTLLDSTFASHGTLTKGPVITVEGQSVIAVNDRSKGGTIYIATTGEPYPIQITGGEANSGKISFGRWNEPIALTAPANAIDITNVKSGQ
jgi:hypothetical protein